MFLYMLVDNTLWTFKPLLLQGEWERFVVLSLVCRNMEHREGHMKSRVDVQICRPLVIGFMDEERV
jgi:hypothetical protein